jgi:HK97 family phage major capsid protein
MSHILMGSIDRQFPRALLGPVRADADPATVIRELKAAFEDFRSRYDGRLGSFEAALDGFAISAAAGRAGPGTNARPDDPEYTSTFANWVRGGLNEQALREANAAGERRAINAALSTGSNPDGGYLAPVEWDRQVSRALQPVSPMRRLATIQTTTVRAYSTLWNSGGWGSGWVGETASRPNTATAQLAPLEFAAGEIYANPTITQNLLDDAAFDIDNWLTQEVAEEFSRQESIAFVSGNGVNKPKGFLQYVTGGAADAAGSNGHPGGNLGVSVSGAAATVTGDGLIDVVYALASPYRANGRWLMNSLTAAAVSKLKDGQGNYIWRESFIVGQPATILGYPVEIDETMPDVAAGVIPIAFGDFKRGYVINDRMGVRVLRDPYTSKPYVNFYTTKRVGGGVWDPKAIRLLKIAAS